MHIDSATGTMWLFTTHNCCNPAAQHRVNINRTVELVQFVNDHGDVLQETVVRPNCNPDEIVINRWR